MFRSKFLIPLRTGFMTMNRYTCPAGFTTAVITPLLKLQTTRLKDSKGSGTDAGSTTESSRKGGELAVCAGEPLIERNATVTKRMERATRTIGFNKLIRRIIMYCVCISYLQLEGQNEYPGGHQGEHPNKVE